MTAGGVAFGLLVAGSLIQRILEGSVDVFIPGFGGPLIRKPASS